MDIFFEFSTPINWMLHMYVFECCTPIKWVFHILILFVAARLDIDFMICAHFFLKDNLHSILLMGTQGRIFEVETEGII